MGRKIFLGEKVKGRLNTGAVTVGTSVVAMSTNSAKLHGGVQVRAATTNAGIVYVGTRENLTAGTADATDGYPLSAGDTVFIPCDAESEVRAIASATSQKLFFLSH